MMNMEEKEEVFEVIISINETIRSTATEWIHSFVDRFKTPSLSIQSKSDLATQAVSHQVKYKHFFQELWEKLQNFLDDYAAVLRF